MTDHDVAVATPSDETNEERPDRSLAEQLVEQARAGGRNLVGPEGLLSDLTKQVLETGLEVEMEDHLGYPKHAVEGRNGANSRNGTRSKTVITEIGRSNSMCHVIVTAASSRQRCARTSAGSMGSIRW